MAANAPRAAVIELKNALQKDPEYAAARRLLGRAHFQVGDMPSALKEFERALDLGLDDDETRLGLLRAKNSLGRYAEVVGALEEEATLAPPFAVVLADAYLLAEDVEKAKPLYQQGTHLPDGLLGMSMVARSENDPERAERYLQRAVETDPDHRDAWLNKAELELAMSDAAGALDSFERAMALPGGAIAGRLGLVRAHLLNEDLDAAEAEVDKALQQAQQYPPAQYLKGLISFKKGDVDAAEAALRVVQQYVPDHVPSLYLMGAVKFQQEQFSQAEDFLRRYLAVDSGNVSVRKLLASIYDRQGENEAILDVLQPAAEGTSDPQLWAMLGAAHLREGASAAATRAFERAVELAPDMAPFRNQLALSLLSSGDEQRAEAELASAIELDGDQFQSDYLMVMLRLRDRDFAAARQAVEQLIGKSPENPIGYNLQGAIALAEDDREAAEAAYARALEVDPSYLPAASNLSRLAEQDGNLARARSYFDQMLSVNSNNEGAQLALADLLVRGQETEAALAILDRTVEQHPQSVRGRLGQLRLLVALGQMERAERAADSALSIAPNVPDLLLLKAEVELKNGDVQEAKSVATRLQGLLSQFESNPMLLAAAGNLQSRVGELTLARSNYEAALRASERPMPEVLVGLARLDLSEGSPGAAQARVDELVADGVSGESLELLKGDVLLAKRELDAARALFAELAATGSRQAVSRLSLVALQQGDQVYAEEVLRDWLREHPEDRGMQMMLANVFIQSGSQSAAKAEYERMLPSDDPVVLNNLAWIYMEEGDSRALETARRANSVAPNNPDISDTLGWILVQSGAVQEGLSFLKTSARARPQNATVQYHLGVAYKQAGQVDSAREALERALAIGGFPEEASAQAELAGI
jgi:putative PEP-CTERM system TPR-repeat lipoprotein